MRLKSHRFNVMKTFSSVLIVFILWEKWVKSWKEAVIWKQIRTCPYAARWANNTGWHTASYTQVYVTYKYVRKYIFKTSEFPNVLIWRSALFEVHEPLLFFWRSGVSEFNLIQCALLHEMLQKCRWCSGPLWTFPPVDMFESLLVVITPSCSTHTPWQHLALTAAQVRAELEKVKQLDCSVLLNSCADKLESRGMSSTKPQAEGGSMVHGASHVSSWRVWSLVLEQLPPVVSWSYCSVLYK